MDASDQLLTVAGIGATLAGFTAIVGIFSTSGQRSEGTRLFFWLMIEFSFATIFFSFLPLVLSNFDIRSATIWAVSSATVAGFIVAHLVAIGAVIKSGFAKGQLPRWGPRIMGPLFVVVLAVQFLNATAVVFHRSYAAYFLGLVLFLTVALANFALLVTKFWESNVTGPNQG